MLDASVGCTSEFGCNNMLGSDSKHTAGGGKRMAATLFPSPEVHTIIIV